MSLKKISIDFWLLQNNHLKGYSKICSVISTCVEYALQLALNMANSSSIVNYPGRKTIGKRN